jgi:hypothetical protein
MLIHKYATVAILHKKSIHAPDEASPRGSTPPHLRRMHISFFRRPTSRRYTTYEMGDWVRKNTEAASEVQIWTPKYFSVLFHVVVALRLYFTQLGAHFPVDIVTGIILRCFQRETNVLNGGHNFVSRFWPFR